MAIYKDVEPLEVMSYKSVNEDFDNGVKYVLEKLDALPTADVVSQEAYEQVKWERDVAIAQLKSYGIGFGEKADVVKVKHGIKHKSSISKTGLLCTACFSDIDRDAVFCKYCGAKMNIERRLPNENTVDT